VSGRTMRMRARTVAATVVIACGTLLVAGAADAQRKDPIRLKPNDVQFNAKISEAVRLLSTDPGGSLAILRRLDRLFPNDDRVLYRLGFTFQVMEQMDSATVYYRRALEVNPGNLEAGKALGEWYISENKRDEAMAVFDRLLAANQHSVGAYKTVGGALGDMGRYEEALRVYTQGRDRSSQHFVLTMDIAALHRSARRFDAALDEYLRYVDSRPANYTHTRARIMEMLREVEDKERTSLTEHLEARARAGTGNRYVVRDVLAAAYLDQGLLEKALDMAIQADGEKESDGAVLLSLADQVLTTADIRRREERGRYLDLAVRALDVFTKNHPRAAGTDRAKYMLAKIYVRLGSGDLPAASAAERQAYVEKAVLAYEDVSKRYSSSEYAELANLERGDLLLHRLKRPDSALEAYRVGAVNSKRYGDVFAARLGNVYLGTGDLAGAERYFQGLMRSGVRELAHTGHFYTGLLLALRGKYEAARDTLSALAESDPSSLYTNDAIETAWIIEEALQYKSKSLGVFMSARQSEMAGDTAAVIAKFLQIVDGPMGDPLRPRALVNLSTAQFQSGDLDGALARLGQFQKEYPDSPLRPDVQRTIAKVYEVGYGQYQKALEEYETVLLMYPDYTFLDEVRKEVRRLRYIVEGAR
jgi:tetratricopeptide (TPR) repeat protein